MQLVMALLDKHPVRAIGPDSFGAGLFQAAPQPQNYTPSIPPISNPPQTLLNEILQGIAHLKTGRIDAESAVPLPTLKIKIGHLPLVGNLFFKIHEGTTVRAHVSFTDNRLNEMHLEVLEGSITIAGVPVKELRITRDGRVFYTPGLLSPIPDYEPAGRWLPLAFHRAEIEISRWVGIDTTNLVGLVHFIAKHIPTGSGTEAAIPHQSLPLMDLASSMNVSGFVTAYGPIPVLGRETTTVQPGTVMFQEHRLESARVDISSVVATQPPDGKFQPKKIVARGIHLDVPHLRCRSLSGFSGDGTVTIKSGEIELPGRLRPEPITIRAEPKKREPATTVWFDFDKTGKTGRLNGSFNVEQLAAGHTLSALLGPQDQEMVMSLLSDGTFLFQQKEDGRITLDAAAALDINMPLGRVLEPILLKAQARCNVFPQSNDLKNGPWGLPFYCRARQADLTWIGLKGPKFQGGFPPEISDHQIEGSIERQHEATVLVINKNVGPYNFLFPRIADGGWSLQGKTVGPPTLLQGLEVYVPDVGDLQFSLDSLHARTATTLSTRNLRNMMVSDMIVRHMRGRAHAKFISIESADSFPFLETTAQGRLEFKGMSFRIDAGEIKLTAIDYTSPTTRFRGTIEISHDDIPNNVLKEIPGTVIRLWNGDGRNDGVYLSMTAENAVLQPDGTIQIDGVIGLHSTRTTAIPKLPDLPQPDHPDLDYPTLPTNITSPEVTGAQKDVMVPWLLRAAAQLLPAVGSVPVVRFVLPHGPGEVTAPLIGPIRIGLKMEAGEWRGEWNTSGGEIRRLDIGGDKPIRTCIFVGESCVTQEEFKLRRIHFLPADDPSPPETPLFGSSPDLPRRRRAGELIFEFNSAPDMSLAELVLTKAGLSRDQLKKLGWKETGLTWTLPIDFETYKLAIAGALFRQAESMQQTETAETGKNSATGAVTITTPIDWRKLQLKWDSSFQAVETTLPGPHDLPLSFTPSPNGSRVRILKTSDEGPFQISPVTVPAVTMGPVTLKDIFFGGGPLSIADSGTGTRGTFETDLRLGSGHAGVGHYTTAIDDTVIHQPYVEFLSLPGSDGEPVTYPALGAAVVAINLHTSNDEQGISGGIHSTIANPRVEYVDNTLRYSTGLVEDPAFSFNFKHFGVRNIDLRAEGIGLVVPLKTDGEPFDLAKAVLSWKEDRLEANSGTLIFGKTKFDLGNKSFIEGARMEIGENGVHVSAQQSRICISSIKSSWLRQLHKIPGLEVEGTEFTDTCFEGAFYKETVVAKGDIKLRGDFKVTSHGALALHYQGRSAISREQSAASPLDVTIEHVTELDYVKNRLRHIVFRNAKYDFKNFQAAISILGALGVEIVPLQSDSGDLLPSSGQIQIGQGIFNMTEDGKLDVIDLQGVRIEGRGFAISEITSGGRRKVLNQHMTLNGRLNLAVKITRGADGKIHADITDYHIDGHVHTRGAELSP